MPRHDWLLGVNAHVREKVIRADYPRPCPRIAANTGGHKGTPSQQTQKNALVPPGTTTPRYSGGGSCGRPPEIKNSMQVQ
jgi:hypothetical protein